MATPNDFPDDQPSDVDYEQFLQENTAHVDRRERIAAIYNELVVQCDEALDAYAGSIMFRFDTRKLLPFSQKFIDSIVRHYENELGSFDSQSNVSTANAALRQEYGRISVYIHPMVTQLARIIHDHGLESEEILNDNKLHFVTSVLADSYLVPLQKAVIVDFINNFHPGEYVNPYAHETQKRVKEREALKSQAMADKSDLIQALDTLCKSFIQEEKQKNFEFNEIEYNSTMGVAITSMVSALNSLKSNTIDSATFDSICKLLVKDGGIRPEHLNLIIATINSFESE